MGIYLKNIASLAVALFFLHIATSVTAQSWHVYDTSNSAIKADTRAVAVDKKGNKWFGLGGGLGLAVLTDTGWISIKAPIGIETYLVQAIAIDDQDVKWFGTVGGVYKLKDTSWTRFTPANSGLCNHSINDIEITKEGVKWFATDGGVCSYNDTTWNSYTTSNSGIAGNSVMNVKFDSKGNAWMATDEGVSTFNGSTWYTYDTTNLNIPIQLIATLNVDQNNNVWFALGDLYGVYRLNDTSLTNFNDQNSEIYDNDIWSIYEDSKGAIWFGTHHSISFLYKDEWTVYKAESTSKCYNVHAIVEDLMHHSMWFASESGAASLDLPVGITEIHLLKKNFAFPIPASNRLFIQRDKEMYEDVTISLIDMYGKCVAYLSKNPDQANLVELDVSSFPAGLYWVKLSGRSGDSGSQLILIEH